MSADAGGDPEVRPWVATDRGLGAGALQDGAPASGRASRRHLLLTALAAAILASVPLPPAGQTPPLPTLRIDAPASLDTVAAQVAQFPVTRLATAMTLSGLSSPGPPIDVLLVAGDSDLARGTPTWISGFADASRNMVVLFPERAGGYPTNSLETLLHHEVAHVLFARAARGRPIPRWFNEGLALAAERPAGLGDRSRLAWTLIRHGDVPLQDLEQQFGEGPAANRRAYAVSSALVRDLLRTYGQASAGRVLARLGQDQPFEASFAAVTGEPLARAVGRFWNRQRLWERWIPFLTGPAFLWMAITGLALIAIGVHQRRRAEQRRRWEEEEQIEAEPAGAERIDAERRLREHLARADPDASGSSYDVH